MRVDRLTQNAIRARAGDCCEYCRVPQACYPERFQVDHIMARQHAGQTVLENLALCCMDCNLHKGPNVAGVDPQTGNIVPLFNPRREKWADHFRFDGAAIVGITPAGRATAAVLNMNSRARLTVRAILVKEGAMPSR